MKKSKPISKQESQDISKEIKELKALLKASETMLSPDEEITFETVHRLRRAIRTK
jgi:hypothetical protein